MPNLATTSKAAPGPRLNLLQLDAGEELIRLQDVPKLKMFGARRGGGRLAPSTAFRWAQRGIKGERLAVIRVGGALCTTERAVIQFFERLTVPGNPDTRTAGQARREVERAEAICQKRGI